MEWLPVSITVATAAEAMRLMARIEQELHSCKIVPEKPCELRFDTTVVFYARILDKNDRGVRNHIDLYWHAICKAIALHFIIEHEERTIERIIRKDYAYDVDEDVFAIKKYCQHVMDDDQVDQLMDRNTGYRNIVVPRAEVLSSAIESFLSEKHQCHMDLAGFVRFRAGEYKKELYEIIEHAIDEFIMEKQYQDFISLLKYFVYVQEVKIPLAHLVHNGDYDFTLLDQQLQPIETSMSEGVVLEMLERDLGYEDMIVSTLIHVSPARIKIHTKEKDMQVIRTILQIYEGRAELCEYSP